MNSSNMKYLSVSSPHTYSMNNIHVPPKVLVPPVFQPASWERERSSASSLEDSQESVSESLEKERHFQQRLQHRILENQEIVGQGPGDTLEDDSLEEDSLEEMSFEEKGAEYDTNKKGKPKVDASGRKKLPVDKYSSLMYNPHWKSAKKGAGFFKAEKAPKISGGSSGDFSEDSFYLHSDDSSENNQQEAKTQDSLPEFGPELFSSHGADVASNEPVGPQAKRKEPADGFHSKNNPGRAFPPQHQQDPPQRAKKNFIKKNKLTLGLQSVKNSYLELHNRKQVLQGQLTDLTPVDEEPLQSVPASQTGKMKPEDKWYPKGQQLKEQHKFFQRNKTESNQTFSARVFPRKDGQEPPGRAAEAKPWLRNQQQIPGFQAAPSPSSALQEYLNPSSSLGPDPAEKPQSGSNNFPNSALTRPTYHYLPIFQNFYPPEVLNPEDPSKENKKYQHEFPTRIPHQQQHFSKNDSSSGQAHPELGNISSDFNAIFQEKVKEQAPIQDFKNHIHEDNSSPTAACRTSHVKEKMEQHQPRISDFGDDFADMWFWGFLPPALPQAQRDSQGISGGAEGNPRKMRRISSEGSLLQNGKQKQPKASKKVCGSKFYINLNMKLGGLGPDYETIKEKALEYAKRIPRPKTFITRPSDQEVKEAVPQPGTSLPQIPSLESLWDRHEREKELVAAFKSLHIF
ncbi:jhy protein homolog isoform X2 [Oenanthe melanoleuca]|uniref:jhy protein homolog isoform X2 n=1 Tax=Oenanthe melanoleuca TaxID=2939378 RepID=UPI0024C0FE11|nr:jhy protein homolog isoform X2 [Oenanthe melanoleuca]